MKGFFRRFQIVLVAGVVSVWFLFGAYLPHARRCKAMQDRGARMRNQIAERAARLGAIRASNIHDTGPGEVTLDVLMPKSVQMGEFLETLDRLAEREGLTERSVEPQDPVDGDEVSWVPIRMSFRGSYPSVRGFIERVEGLPRLARIQDMTVERAEEKGELLSSTLTMHVYYRRS